MSNHEPLNRITDRIQSREQLQELSPKGVWDSSLTAAINSLSFNTPTADAAVDKAMIALKAGLHLCNDSLDESHAYSQEIEDDSTGGYWHGLMHRMEGDYSNANYWFSRAGAHLSQASIQSRVSDYLRSDVDLEELPSGAVREALLAIRDGQIWLPQILTGAIAAQESGQEKEETRPVLQMIQQIELAELLAFTITAATKEEQMI
ncbi:hypothetical protein [Paenibacillus nasutitermitis]|uniref:Uncharacterized protein n=1 Tax=Paenibacillus nasutitermitis TaxID=1652958 RepID=A0A916YKZ6_9BACL|nr:hypothetical protein [Paenibacillus nasutitermitis]GGD48773.1 hypothetical protein GCM10010911_02850 [Paenibacillus nasutitermitis]